MDLTLVAPLWELSALSQEKMRYLSRCWQFLVAFVECQLTLPLIHNWFREFEKHNPWFWIIAFFVIQL
ncbi:hypothetical protein LB505_010817 [Fusarium chuoi]|nr:hypothetical protein LB505_010817 [Fusarium chuoi]